MSRKPRKRGLSIISEWSSKGKSKSKSAGAVLGTQLDPPPPAEETTQSLDGGEPRGLVDDGPPPPPSLDGGPAGSRRRGISLDSQTHSDSPTSPASKAMKEIASSDEPPYGIR